MKGDSTEANQYSAQPQRAVAAAEGDHNQARHVQQDSCEDNHCIIHNE